MLAAARQVKKVKIPDEVLCPIITFHLLVVLLIAC